jgi:hypothetical protein
MTGFFGPVEQYDFVLGGLKNIPSSHLWILLWDGGSWFYMADKPAPSQDRDLHPFENIAAEPLDSWRSVNDESATPYVKLLARRITKLSKDGLKGIDTINC